MLTSNTELGDPETTKDVIPSHPEHEGVRGKLDISGDWVNFWMFSRENPERSIHPHYCSDGQGKKGLQEKQIELGIS